MTGLEALADAARLEQARIYGTTSTEYRQPLLVPLELGPLEQRQVDELAARRQRHAAACKRWRHQQRNHA